MDTVAHEKWNEAVDANDSGLLAHEMLSHDVYDLPDGDALVFCPECYEMAETFGRIDHPEWCSFSDSQIRPGNF